eukprot:TRINITY_DN5813_c0_g3_i1.p1 TRINITY_DN5813_c0_g3~~TRINITY_DN5813_c0_g3_i1.p1  ORF type:complete len:168 (-),score=28.61 TRINITY_DN5813_c0_g3_i1:28-504(-)
MTETTGHNFLLELGEGTRIWVSDKNEGYIAAQVKSSDRSNVTYSTEEEPDKVLSIDTSQVFLRNPKNLEGADELTVLSFLHEPAVLMNLKTRYLNDMIYTYSGPILIALNPYKKLRLYTDALIKQYCGKPLGKLQPHIYAIAENAYRSMLTGGFFLKF